MPLRSRSPRRRAVAGLLVLGLSGGVLVALAPIASAAPQNAVITGVVRGADGRPLQGVDVTAAHYTVLASFPPQIDVYGEAVTGADGSYRMTVQPTDETLRVQFTPRTAIGGTSATGYADQCFTGTYTCVSEPDREFTVRAGRTIAGVDVRLPRAAEIRGRAVDADGRSVSRLPVRLKQNGSCDPFDDLLPFADAVTDVNGNYVVRRLPAFTVAVCLGDGVTGAGRPSPYGYAPRTVTVTTRAGAVSGPVTVLREAGGVSGRVVDADGAPIAGAHVQVLDRPFAPNADTAANGSFRILGITLGDQQVCVEAGGYVGTCDGGGTTVTVRSGVTTSVGRIVLRLDS